jgi:hypothetical protein
MGIIIQISSRPSRFPEQISQNTTIITMYYLQFKKWQEPFLLCFKSKFKTTVKIVETVKKILKFVRMVRRHNSPRTIHCGTIHRTQFTAHNSPCTIHHAQFTAAQFTAGTIYRRHDSPRIIHHEKILIPLDEFSILLD